jgi:hypothetical protein
MEVKGTGGRVHGGGRLCDLVNYCCSLENPRMTLGTVETGSTGSPRIIKYKTVES